eukprot:CAMPEP_0185757804 /NCGR_PEP_ID=MMETSP1174-20130828/16301_1 /TAXON_ID=35687 /ORGANISM="Dictyocha speculum, Strain CCMP1381" /LENGTH=385 /DNA_ID=CAMNT_0028437349 /DNA_START=90 /DNA_END=1247 /DNA_ORIENTATION=-
MAVVFREVYIHTAIFAAMAFGIGSAGFLYERKEVAREDRCKPELGQRVPLTDGRRVHIRRSDAGSVDSSPTVVFEAGHGETLYEWERVVKMVSPFANCFSYTRSGLGLSDSSSDSTETVRDGKSITQDLETYLKALGVTGPIVVVAHGTGGLYARMLAERRGSLDVAGLVLIDPVVEGVQAEHCRLSPQVETYVSGWRGQALMMARLAEFGFLRLRGQLSSKAAAKLEFMYGVKDGAPLLDMCSRASHRRTMIQEMDGWEETFEELSSESELRCSIPTVVISHGGVSFFQDFVELDDDTKFRMEQVWDRAQEKLIGKYDRGARVRLPEGTISMHLSHAGEVARVIQAVIEEAQMARGHHDLIDPIRAAESCGLEGLKHHPRLEVV